jgi:two-component system sensor histidine kinase/response regulator
MFEPMPEHPRHSPPRRPVVLLVAADEVARATYAYGLSALGFDLVVAADARQAHARSLVIQPDVIVTERPQLEIDRWPVLRALKSDPRTRGIPVVILTDSTAHVVRERAEREGCDALCLKPCEASTLALALRAVLDRRPPSRLRDAHALR